MKEPATLSTAQAGFFPEADAPDSTGKATFKGTQNPRHLRALAALLNRPLPRENLDSVAGCSNGPQLVADLRALGLALPCTRVSFTDRDGRRCRPGVYSLAVADRRAVIRWLAQRGKAGG